MKTHSLAFAAALTVATFVAPQAAAQVAVDFSGGNGSPLSFTLPNLTWVVTNADALNGGLAVLTIEVNNPPSWSSGVVTSSNPALWSTNNGGITFNNGNGYNFYANAGMGNPFAGKVAWFGIPFSGSFQNGNTITFAGGTLGGTSSPSNSFVDGTYTINLTNTGANVGAVVAVPEPSTSAGLAGALILAATVLRRRNLRVG